MASTERAKPNERDNHGSAAVSTTTAPASAGTPRRVRPEASPSRPTAPITAARSTLGSGRARTTNPASAAPASTSLVRRDAPQPPATISTVPQTIATLLPDTAQR